MHRTSPLTSAGLALFLVYAATACSPADSDTSENPDTPSEVDSDNAATADDVAATEEPSQADETEPAPSASDATSTDDSVETDTDEPAVPPEDSDGSDEPSDDTTVTDDSSTDGSVTDDTTPTDPSVTDDGASELDSGLTGGEPTEPTLTDDDDATEADAQAPMPTDTDPDETTDPPPSAGNTPPIRASELAMDLSGSGLDPLALPPLLDDADNIAHVTLMHSFEASLGTGCNTCHEGDRAVWTETKRVAKHMWEDVLGKLEMADGSPLYCDSCHQGSLTFLDRSDLAALEVWMQQNMVDKLVRRDGQPHDCSTCHGTPANYALIETWSME